jgi:hypothetical protein
MEKPMEKKKPLYPAQMETQELGELEVDVTSISNNRPLEGTIIDISTVDEPEIILEEITTDSSGHSPVIDLPTPPRSYSEEPSAEQPYADYVVTVKNPGYEDVVVTGVELLSGELAIQPVQMLAKPQNGENEAESIVIGPHTLFGDFPPKIAESEIKPLEESGEIVLSRVVIPEYIVVHDGPPSDSSAQNYYVKYKDYIKNVACSEIYATWPEETIKANVLAIQSFTLNRVYTEWYRNKGYSFTITSSTAYDHKWIYGRNIFSNISGIVDSIFNYYLSRPNVKQPILTQYCDGNKVSCPDWMTQWGSKDLGDQGYTAIQILRNFYGNTMYINQAEEISGVPSSWPGYDLTIGSRGQKVRQLQEQLNGIAKGYPLVPKVTADGIYGQNTADSVKVFQQIFKLPETGEVDFKTWYKISEIYVGVSRIAELV